MNIIEVKARLNLLGFGPLSVTGPEAAVFGPKTTEAIKRFQQANRLEIDGKPGPQTLSALFPEPVKYDKYHLQPWDINSPEQKLKLRALHILLAQNGVREKFSNGGPAIETMLSSVGLGPGYSWCAAFIFWGFDQAAHELKITNPLPRTGGCLNHWNSTKAIKFKTDSQNWKPEAGDVFIMAIGNEGAGHTGMVIKPLEGGLVQTIEGNTNDNGSSNGDGVYIRERKVIRLLGFIRY